jgi:PPE-repeat protein
MTLVVTELEMLTAEAGDVGSVRSAVSAGNAAATAPVTGVVPAAADEVSALTAAQFTAHAAWYQAVRVQAGFHEMFVATLDGAAGAHAASEAVDAAAPQPSGQGLVTDFAAVPPEVHSARMYAGPGSGPMLAAAAAWDELASELNWAAVGCDSVVSGPSGGSSALATEAAAAYMGWMNATAAKAEQAAAQAKAAAAAFETAFSMTVPPPVIAANRSLWKSLAATNFLGQHTPAIATTEAHYGEMWAQDAAAMYGYASASATASTLAPFTLPPQSTSTAGLAGEAAAVTQLADTSAAASAGTSAETTLSKLMSAVPEALGSLASPLSASGSQLSRLTSKLASLNSEFGAPLTAPAANGSWVAGAITLLASAMKALTPVAKSPTEGVNAAAPAVAGGTEVSARLAQAAWVGALSVPRGWVTSLPAVRPAAVAPPDTTFSFEPPPMQLVFGIA